MSVPVHIIGDYPPCLGGVADYTSVFANALADRGHDVHVWTTSGPAVDNSQPYHVHRVGVGYGPSHLMALDAALAKFEAPRRLLIQYVPHAFGRFGMNLRFANWVSDRGGLGDSVQIMFHEVSFPIVRWPLHHNAIALANRWMLWKMLRTAQGAFVSIEGWKPIVRRYGRRNLPVVWLPIPSTLPRCDDVVGARRRIRLRIGVNTSTLLLGHFGTYGALIADQLSLIFPQVLRDAPDATLIALGCGSIQWADRFRRSFRDLAHQVIAGGEMEKAVLAEYLVACDIVLQPYPDGVSARRTTTMAALANGCAVISNSGALTDPIWLSEDGIMDVGSLRPESWSVAVATLSSDAKSNERLRRSALALYDQNFAINKIIDRFVVVPQAAVLDRVLE